MADFHDSTTVAASTGAVFDFLAEVANLPRYFDRMTSAAPGEGEEVTTTASLPDGRSVEGTAWFRVDRPGQRIEWGSEGPSNYHGQLAVTADGDGDGDGSVVTVQLHTTRVDDGNDEVRAGLAQTLTNIKAQVEGD